MSLDKPTLTVAETAEALSLGRNTTLGLIHSGQLRAIRVGRRLIVPARAIEDFLGGTMPKPRVATTAVKLAYRITQELERLKPRFNTGNNVSTGADAEQLDDLLGLAEDLHAYLKGEIPISYLEKSTRG